MAAIPIDLDRLKRMPLRLKVIAGVVALDLLILVLGYVVLNDLMAQRVAEVERLRASVTQVRRQNADLRRVADEYPGLRKRYDEVIAAGLSAPLDRLALVKFAQDWAAHHHLLDLHYRLAADTAKPATSPKFRVDTERVVFENGGLFDTDERAFLQDLLAQQPGHFRLAEIEISRTHDMDAAYLTGIRRGSFIPSLKAKIDLQWVGVQPKTPEEP